MKKKIRSLSKSFLKNIFGEKRYYTAKYRVRLLKWFLNKPPYPSLETNKVNIHLGCGKINHPDFINVDLALYPHIHHLSNVSDLKIFEDNFADLIYVSHCLEHIPHPQILSVLEEWNRVLKPEGVLRISVPNFDTIIDIYNDTNKDLTELQGPLMGGNDSVYNVHHVVFNDRYLEQLLQKAGYKDIRLWEIGEDNYSSFDDWSGKKVSVNNRNYFISLNMQGIKK